MVSQYHSAMHTAYPRVGLHVCLWLRCPCMLQDDGKFLNLHYTNVISNRQHWKVCLSARLDGDNCRLAMDRRCPSDRSVQSDPKACASAVSGLVGDELTTGWHLLNWFVSDSAVSTPAITAGPRSFASAKSATTVVGKRPGIIRYKHLMSHHFPRLPFPHQLVGHLDGVSVLFRKSYIVNRLHVDFKRCSLGFDLRLKSSLQCHPRATLPFPGLRPIIWGSPWGSARIRLLDRRQTPRHRETFLSTPFGLTMNRRPVTARPAGAEQRPAVYSVCSGRSGGLVP